MRYTSGAEYPMSDDLRQIRALWRQLHEWHNHQAPDRYEPATDAAFASWYAWAVKEHVFLTERVDGVILGYATVRLATAIGNSLMRERTYAYLDHLVIDVDHRRSGLGRRLMGQVLRFGQERGVDSLELDCRTENPARDFFANIGFHPVSQRMAIMVANVS